MDFLYITHDHMIYMCRILVASATLCKNRMIVLKNAVELPLARS